MNIWPIETASGFDYGWSDPLLDPFIDEFFRIILSGRNLVFGADGLPVSGDVTGFTVMRENPGTGSSAVLVQADGIGPIDLSSITTMEQVETEIVTGIGVATLNDAASQYFQGGPYAHDLIRVSGTDGATLRGTDGPDFFELRGTDMTVRSGAGADQVVATQAAGKLFVNLGAGDDSLTGHANTGAVALRVWGKSGDDILIGGDGADILYGGLG